ncbi:hypothetical protein VTL71DRAFT_12755 [Oculimacula yallundae]|uniref:Uncharacterized protein n=1 Tax=Oculimacula yallundae TaxID=86028 RepID=A0ABR4CNP2_9HELO
MYVSKYSMSYKVGGDIEETPYGSTSTLSSVTQPFVKYVPLCPARKISKLEVAWHEHGEDCGARAPRRRFWMNSYGMKWAAIAP